MLPRYIFLDVDGVLNDDTTENRTPNGYFGVADEYIERLVKIVNATKAKIVLSSDWRRYRDSDDVFYGDAKYLEKRLEEHGLKISACLRGGGSFYRGLEIMDFVDEHPCRSFVILDDRSFDYCRSKKLNRQFVKTNTSNDGLSDENVKQAIKLLKDDIEATEW